MILGRRSRRTDPSLPEDLVVWLKSHLGLGRSGVRAGKTRFDEDAVAEARTRVGLAKLGLGERGPCWWDQTPAARMAQARHALQQPGTTRNP